MAVALKEAADPSFREYIIQVKRNAATLAQCMQDNGYNIVTNGTDNHIVLWDARSTGLSGAMIEKLLEKCEISVNKNSIVGDVSAISPGGVRLGTPAVTTRGFKEREMKYVADVIHRIVQLGQQLRSSKALKLKEFMERAESDTYRGQLAALRREVESFSVKYFLPGIVP